MFSFFLYLDIVCINKKEVKKRNMNEKDGVEKEAKGELTKNKFSFYLFIYFYLSFFLFEK